MTPPGPYAGSVWWNLHENARVVASIVVAAGVLHLPLGLRAHRDEVNARNCAHEKVSAAVLDSLFGADAMEAADRARIARWARRSGVLLQWRPMDGAAAATLEEIVVVTCNATLERSSYASELGPFDNRKLKDGVVLLFYGLVALGALHWLEWMLARRP